MSTTISLTGNSSVLETQYYPPISVGPNARCGLISMHTTNSIPNIDFHNNKFYFGTKMFTIRTGAYELNELLDYISFCTESDIHITDLAIYKQNEKFVVIDRHDKEDQLRILAESLDFIPNSTQIVINENGTFTNEKLNIKIFIPNGDYLAGDVNSYINAKVQERIFGMEETKKIKNINHLLSKRSINKADDDDFEDEDYDGDYGDDYFTASKKLKSSSKENNETFTISSTQTPVKSPSVLSQVNTIPESLPIPEALSHSLDNIEIDQHQTAIPDNVISKSIGPRPSPSPHPNLNPGQGNTSNSPISQKPIIFNINKHTGKIMLYSREDINFKKESTVGPLLGFNKRILKANQWHISDNIVSITNINNIAVHCNIISGSYQNNNHVHIIHEFDMQAPAGYKIAEVPKNILYLKVTSDLITSITVKITNQHGELIDLRGEQVSVRLHIINE